MKTNTTAILGEMNTMLSKTLADVNEIDKVYQSLYSSASRKQSQAPVWNKMLKKKRQEEKWIKLSI